MPDVDVDIRRQAFASITGLTAWLCYGVKVSGSPGINGHYLVRVRDARWDVSPNEHFVKNWSLTCS